MYERFTDRSRKVMQLANRESQRLNHDYIGPEHVLLGLIKEGSGVAANVLIRRGLDHSKIQSGVATIVPRGGKRTVINGQLPLSPRAKQLIEDAMEEARKLNHNYVGTEHLLLGLLQVTEGVGAQVLRNLGLKLEDIRQDVLDLLGHGNAANSDPA